MSVGGGILRNLFRRLSNRPTDVGRVAIVTANFGGIDNVHPLPASPSIDAFYFTEAITQTETPPEIAASWGGLIVPNFPRHDFNPRLRAKYFKLQIHRLDLVANHRWLVWIDGSLQFLDISFLLEKARYLSKLPPHQRALFIPHPFRQTVEEEYHYVKSEIENGSEYLRVRYDQEKMSEQIQYFAESNLNLKSPLICGGFWMIENSDLNQRCWDAWWDQNLRFGMMDQLSLPIMLEKFGIEPQRLPIDIYKNDLFEHHGHR
jgi:hypothetical protein